jgi:hypothetical protein
MHPSAVKIIAHKFGGDLLVIGITFTPVTTLVLSPDHLHSCLAEPRQLQLRPIPRNFVEGSVSFVI